MLRQVLILSLILKILKKTLYLKLVIMQEYQNIEKALNQIN